MRIEKRNYSRGAWRLVTDAGNQVTTTLLNDAGDVMATSHPVCGQTKAEVMAYALGELERIVIKNRELEWQNKTLSDLLEKYTSESDFNVCA